MLSFLNINLESIFSRRNYCLNEPGLPKTFGLPKCTMYMREKKYFFLIIKNYLLLKYVLCLYSKHRSDVSYLYKINESKFSKLRATLVFRRYCEHENRSCRQIT